MIEQREATTEKPVKWYVYLPHYTGIRDSIRISMYKNKRQWERSYTFNTLNDAITFLYQNIVVEGKGL